MKSPSGQNGFSLMEVALSLSLVGIVLSIVLSFYNVHLTQERTRITRERMDRIVGALSTYVETASRLPCPSDPASPAAPTAADPVLGWERGVSYSQTTVASAMPVGSCDGTTADGIVPYITLGIPYETIVDGWGHYFTYAVSPVFTQPTDESGGGGVETGNVHALCRTGRWVSNNDNANGPKAKFCCAMDNAVLDPSTDIVMRDTANRRLVPARIALNNYGPVGQRYVSIAGENEVALDLRDDIEAPAFVLISHGRNRFGAYLADNTAGRIPFSGVGANANRYERRNADETNRNYYIGPANEAAGVNYFDDIVTWRTQNGLMAYNGTSSCAYP